MYLSLETSCEFCSSALWEKIRCDARWTSRRCVPRKQTKALGGSQARIYNISPGTINYTWSMSCVSVTTNLYLGVGMICLRETGISGVEMTHSVSCERWFFSLLRTLAHTRWQARVLGAHQIWSSSQFPRMSRHSYASLTHLFDALHIITHGTRLVLHNSASIRHSQM